MNTNDIHIFESGDGGEMKVSNGDLVLSNSLFQSIYITLFGGNIEASTLGNENDSEQRFDWWANDLIFKDNKTKQFNSETERCLNRTVLDSRGRLKIKSAVESDLSGISNISNFEVDVIIVSLNRVKINIFCSNPSDDDNTIVTFLWDGARDELIFNTKI